MIGLLLVYFLWKYFSELAVEHNKSKWGYGLLGIAAYYLGTILFGAAIGIIDAIAETNYVEETNNIVLNIASLPFGLLSAWGLYKQLENKWSTQKFGDGDSLDHELQDANADG
jgi:hypothetical protein